MSERTNCTGGSSKAISKKSCCSLSSGDVEQEEPLVRLPCYLLDAFKFLSFGIILTSKF